MQSRPNYYDVLILGGGPAGMSAAIWAVDLGLTACLIEKAPSLGGQLHAIHNPIENYLGIRAANGEELLEKFSRSVHGLDFEQRLDVEILNADLENSQVVTRNGEILTGRSMILATGVRRRKLGIAGENEFEGRGVLRSGAASRDIVRDRVVLIVGGGDAAFENALMLSKKAERVILVHRRDRPSARQDFIGAVAALDNVEFLPNTELSLIGGDDTVKAATLIDSTNGDSRELPVDFVLIRVGVEPNSEMFRNEIDLDGRGYVKVDSEARTTIPGVYAIGDLANPTSPTISTAAGTGATAVKSIAAWLREC